SLDDSRGLLLFHWTFGPVRSGDLGPLLPTIPPGGTGPGGHESHARGRKALFGIARGEYHRRGGGLYARSFLHRVRPGTGRKKNFFDSAERAQFCGPDEPATWDRAHEQRA